MEKVLSLYYVLTDDYNDPLDIFIEKATRCLNQGHTLIQLRKKQCSTEQYYDYAIALIELASSYQARVVLNATPEFCSAFPVAGVHLTSQRLMQLQQRPLDSNHLVSAACHDLQQLQHAEKIGVDFVTLSPVLPTATHPENLPLGWYQFASWHQVMDLPVYALGGMEAKLLKMAQAQGAYGIAAIRAFWI